MLNRLENVSDNKKQHIVITKSTQQFSFASIGIMGRDMKVRGECYLNFNLLEKVLDGTLLPK